MRKVVKAYAVANTIFWAVVGAGICLDYQYEKYGDLAGDNLKDVVNAVRACTYTGIVGWRKFFGFYKKET